MKPYYEHKGITIYHGDCRKVLPTLSLPDCLVVMDPPYGIEHETSHGASWENSQIQNDHSTELRDWLIGTLMPRSMVVFGTWKAPKPPAVKAVLVWDKGPAFGMGDLSFPWKNSWEEIYIIGDGFQGKRDEGVLRGHMVVSWESKGRVHQHQKPVSLLGHFMNKHYSPIVLDPTMGSGSTLEAAKLNNRSAIGIEIEEKYCEIAAKRLEQEVFDFQ